MGLLTDAIGKGRKAAGKMSEVVTLSGKELQVCPSRPMIDYSRVKLEYFDPRLSGFERNRLGARLQVFLVRYLPRLRDMRNDLPESAISRQTGENGAEYEMVVNAEKCIGCGFCAGACPCGV